VRRPRVPFAAPCAAFFLLCFFAMFTSW